MSWDSILYAWSESHRFVRSKLWDSWDWRENIQEEARRQAQQEALAKPASSQQQCVVFPRGSSCSTSYSAMMLPAAGSGFLRLAGFSGAVAVALGAYGAHHFAGEAKPEYKRIYDTANFYHFMHTIALLGVPLTRRPRLTGTLMVAGMAVFCGTTYYHALTQEKSLRRFTPYGGILLILAWLSMVA